MINRDCLKPAGAASRNGLFFSGPPQQPPASFLSRYLLKVRSFDARGFILLDGVILFHVRPQVRGFLTSLPFLFYPMLLRLGYALPIRTSPRRTLRP